MRKLRSCIQVFVAAVCAVTALSCASHDFPIIRPAARLSREQIERQRAQEYFVRGRDFDRRGLPQMAVRLYEMAWEFDHTSDLLRMLLAEKYVEIGKYPQAIIKITNGRDAAVLSEQEKNMLATVYLKMGEFNKASGIIDGIEEKSDDNLYSLALIHESLGRTDLAIQAYLAFLSRNPSALQVALKVTGFLVRVGRYEQADSLIAVIEGRFGNSPELKTLKGTAALGAGDTSGALGFLQEALAMDSSFEDALQGSAQLYIARKEYPSAIDMYRRLASSPFYGEVYGRTLALLYYYNDQFAEARALLQNLLSSAMADYELHFYLGLVVAAEGNADVARLQFEKTLAIQSSFEDAWEQLCLLSIRKRDIERARADAERFVAALPTKAGAWRMLGYVYGLGREYARASDAFRRSLGIDSSSAQTWFEFGSSLERRKQIDSATAAFRRALALEPRDHGSANYLGYMWAERGLYLDSAKLLIRLALEEQPENGAYLDSYAWVLYQQGAYDSALVYMERAVARVGDDAVVMEHMGDIRMKLGMYRDAFSAYERALELTPEDPGAVERKRNEAMQRAKSGSQ